MPENKKPARPVWSDADDAPDLSTPKWKAKLAAADEQARPVAKGRLTALLSLGGAGALSPAPRSARDIDRHIRWLRDNG